MRRLFILIIILTIISCTLNNDILQNSVIKIYTTSSRGLTVPASVQSLKLSVEGEGVSFSPLSFAPGEEITAEVNAGDSRLISLEAFDSDGSSIYIGTSSENLEAGETTEIILNMDWTLSLLFDGNFADSGSMEGLRVAVGETISLPSNVFVKSGYSFTGWNTTADGSGDSYAGGASYTRQSMTRQTLYAQWGTASYSINFNGNGSDGGVMTAQSVSYGETVNLNPNGFSLTGYAFSAWNTQSDGSGTDYFDSASYTHSVSSDITLYAQWLAPQTYTFTAAGAAGASGPTQSMLTSAYSGTSLDGAVTNPSADDGYQLWTVPATGTYTIEARGAQGAENYDSSYTGANGAVMIGDFNLSSGEQLIILVGQQGSQSVSSTLSSAGGGGSFVTLVDSGSSYTIAASSYKVTPLIVAGGGGGVGGSGSALGVAGDTGTDGTLDGGGYGTPGTAGGGGLSGSTDNTSGGGGGGGFIGDGTAQQSNSGYPGLSFLNGAAGGSSRDGDSYGGFGGGGGNHNTSGGGGAGGGYSGGTGGQYYLSVYYGGGGGGSFNSGTSQSNTAGGNTGDGSVIITLQ